MNEARTSSTPLSVIELFAGVGGFRMGLEAVKNRDAEPAFRVIWSNQFEPGCQKQHAARVYRQRWGTEGFVNRDINEVLADKDEMSKLNHLALDVLVGGFPCQDYSVARPAGQSVGLEGKKGVLWWSIYRILQERVTLGRPLKYLVLENVDRLLNSPSACRGRDFAVILSSLQNLGYGVEWRVINAGDYGYPQRRRRIFVVAYHASTALYDKLAEAAAFPGDWMTSDGVLARAFPATLKKGGTVHHFDVPSDVLQTQDVYSTTKGRSRFASAGFCVDGMAATATVTPASIRDFTRYVARRAPVTLRDVVQATRSVPAEYFVAEADLSRWHYLKGAKSVPRRHATGYEYLFSEGAVAFPDPLDRPSRTILTSEGGNAPSRTRHAVQAADGRLRRLVPDELEALNGFPRGFTDIPGIPPAKRAFMMGNALVVGIITRIGQALHDCHACTGPAALG